ncbi:MAG TPA: HDOD domain-containing protein [Kofleriaceae bacterium]|jgi:putative nucleotidyltransferase with HDIG domain
MVASNSIPPRISDEVAITKAIDALPTLPVVALKIGEVIHSKNVTVNQIAELLETDPSTSAKLLRLVNSPYFGIPGGVSDVSRAIPFVGFNTLYQLVLGVSVIETLDVPGGARSLWLHSLTVATAARELANELKCPDAGACFTAGLLHDMGKIALAKVAPEKLAAASTMMQREGITLQEAERRVELAPHDRVGARLAKQWRFPANLAAPIEHHHGIHKPAVRERLAPNLRSITEIVTAADYLAHACADTFGDTHSMAENDPETAELLDRNGFSGDKLQGLRTRTLKQLERSKVFLSVLDGPAHAAKAG